MTFEDRVHSALHGPEPASALRALVGEAAREGYKKADIIKRLEKIAVLQRSHVDFRAEDEAVLFETVLVVSLMNFANRFAMGCGLVADF